MTLLPPSISQASSQHQLLDPRWCEHGHDRYGEHGVIGAEQADESHLDGRYVDDEEEEKNEEEETTRLAQNGRIRFSNKKLYGRQGELDRLKGLFNAVLLQPPLKDDDTATNNQSRREVTEATTKTVFVSGFSGCGKTALIQAFVEDVRSTRRGHEQVLFLTAKYERTQSSAPFSAFSTLFDQIPLSLECEFRHVYASLHDSLGDDVTILRRIFPQLRYLFYGRNSIGTVGGSGSLAADDVCSLDSSHNSTFGGGRVSTTSSKTLERQQSRVASKARLKFVISSLFRALSQYLNNRPLILFVDDLQWADHSGLELLQTLISEESLQYLLFIGSYRSNEINDNQHFQKMLENIEGKVPYESMHLAEISCEATGEFISDTLGLSTKDVEPLTQVVYNKTLGNPLYTRQALEHLVRKNALYYDNVVFSWNWNLGSTRDTSKSATSKCLEDVLADDVLSMVTSKIETIPNKGLQQILAAASFVRASFDSDTLFRVLMSVNDSSQTLQGSSNFFSDTSSFVESREILEQLLGQAVEEGLLLRLSDSQDDNQMYAFAHDQIQEAASNFVSNESEERELFLIKVGVGLLQRAEAIQKDEAWMLFAAARNLNSVPSSHAMFDDAFKIKLVEMNLHTAHLSLSLLAFENAVEYVTKGLSLLTELSSDIWSIHYDFTQNLLNIAAQAELGAGHMDKAEAFCKEVLNQKTHTFSALPSYKVYLDILGGREDHEAALEMNLDVLEELSGIKFPKTDRGIRMKAWVTLQWMKAGGLPTEEKIINMSYASDAVAVATMEFIQKAVRFAFVLKPHLYILLCCESIKWMTKYGLTDTSGASTASFANVVMHKFGDFATGAKLAKLAIFIVDKQKNKFYETQALNTANTNVLGWITPIKTRLPYHVRAYESGVTSGNLEGACVGKWFQFWVLYHSASPLSILEHDLQVMRNKAEKWGYMFFRNFYSLLLQVVLNLSGKSENTTKLIGSSVDETDPMWQKMPHKALLETFRSQLMVFFGDFEKGAEDALVRGNFYSKKMIGMQYGLEPFYRGICLYAMGRKTGDKKFIKAAKEVRKIYQVWVRKGCMNLVGLLKLFDAEELALAVRKEKPACKKYEDSIQTLATGGFYSNAGVASERYATYLAERGFREESRTQLELAKSYYCRWGALKKVEILTNQLASFQ